MEEHSGIPYPDGYSYTTVINCFARSIGELAIWILQITKIENGIALTHLCIKSHFSSFMCSLSLPSYLSSVDRKAKKARRILDKMIQSYSAGNTAAKP